MRWLYLLPLLVMVAGCGTGAPTKADKKDVKETVAETGPLSAEETVAWEKLRKKHPEPEYFVMALRGKPGEWRFLNWNGSDFHAQWLTVPGQGYDNWRPTPLPKGSGPGKMALDVDGEVFVGFGESLSSGLEQALARARKEASEPENKVVAVVDLYSAPAPKILHWCVDAGKGVTTSDRPPSSAVEKSALEFLRNYQHSVGR